MEPGTGATTETPKVPSDIKRQIPTPVVDLRDLDEEDTKVPEDPSHVRDVFHPHLPAVSTNSTLNDVARTMVHEAVHAVVVIDEDDGSLAGVISQTDLVLARQRGTDDEVGTLTAAAIMTPDPYTIAADDTIQHAISIMTAHKVHRLVVVEERNGKTLPVGICAMTDIIRHMFHFGPRP
ncbi:MAG: CBS domain-containing protein [Deltaproteobacteria bacterium]|nr:CBS domain-containing protein [Deltaproteobacteria bacterium]